MTRERPNGGPSWNPVNPSVIYCVVLLVIFNATCSYSAPVTTEVALPEYEKGCYYMLQHYDEGERIITNEPCLNCTCHDSMLMCFLKVCPFAKPIGQDCVVEKRPDQCCPVITCPEVPVPLMIGVVSTTTRPVIPSFTGLATLSDEEGCLIDGKYYPDGAQVPSDPNKPCDLCYCIRNHTACVMQECILYVDGCSPVFEDGVCCPVRYECERDKRPLIIGTTAPPAITSSDMCVRNGEVYNDGAMVPTEDPCEHCYCMHGDIVCAVQECGRPMQPLGNKCVAVPPTEGQCCPDTYECTPSVDEATQSLGLTSAAPVDGEENADDKNEVPEVIAVEENAKPGPKPDSAVDSASQIQETTVSSINSSQSPDQSAESENAIPTGENSNDLTPSSSTESQKPGDEEEGDNTTGADHQKPDGETPASEVNEGTQEDSQDKNTAGEDKLTPSEQLPESTTELAETEDDVNALSSGVLPDGNEDAETLAPNADAEQISGNKVESPTTDQAAPEVVTTKPGSLNEIEQPGVEATDASVPVHPSEKPTAETGSETSPVKETGNDANVKPQTPEFTTEPSTPLEENTLLPFVPETLPGAESSQNSGLESENMVQITSNTDTEEQVNHSNTDADDVSGTASAEDGVDEITTLQPLAEGGQVSGESNPVDVGIQETENPATDQIIPVAPEIEVDLGSGDVINELSVDNDGSSAMSGEATDIPDTMGLGENLIFGGDASSKPQQPDETHTEGKPEGIIKPEIDSAEKPEDLEVPATDATPEEGEIQQQSGSLLGGQSDKEDLSSGANQEVGETTDVLDTVQSGAESTDLPETSVDVVQSPDEKPNEINEVDTASESLENILPPLELTTDFPTEEGSGSIHTVSGDERPDQGSELVPEEQEVSTDIPVEVPGSSQPAELHVVDQAVPDPSSLAGQGLNQLVPEPEITTDVPSDAGQGDSNQPGLETATDVSVDQENDIGSSGDSMVPEETIPSGDNSVQLPEDSASGVDEDKALPTDFPTGVDGFDEATVLPLDEVNEDPVTDGPVKQDLVTSAKPEIVQMNTNQPEAPTDTNNSSQGEIEPSSHNQEDSGASQPGPSDLDQTQSETDALPEEVFEVSTDKIDTKPEGSEESSTDMVVEPGDVSESTDSPAEGQAAAAPDSPSGTSSNQPEDLETGDLNNNNLSEVFTDSSVPESEEIHLVPGLILPEGGDEFHGQNGDSVDVTDLPHVENEDKTGTDAQTESSNLTGPGDEEAQENGAIDNGSLAPATDAPIQPEIFTDLPPGPAEGLETSNIPSGEAESQPAPETPLQTGESEKDNEIEDQAEGTDKPEQSHEIPNETGESTDATAMAESEGHVEIGESSSPGDNKVEEHSENLVLQPEDLVDVTTFETPAESENEKPAESGSQTEIQVNQPAGPNLPIVPENTNRPDDSDLAESTEPDEVPQPAGEPAKPAEEVPVESTDLPEQSGEQPVSPGNGLEESVKPADEVPVDSTELPEPLDEKLDTNDQVLSEMGKPAETEESTDLPQPVDGKPDSHEQAHIETSKPAEELPLDSTDVPGHVDEKPDSVDDLLAQSVKPAEEVAESSTDLPASVDGKPESIDQTSNLMKPSEETPVDLVGTGDEIVDESEKQTEETAIDSTDAPASADEKPDSAEQGHAESVRPAEESPAESTDAPAALEEKPASINEKPDSADQTLPESVRPAEEIPVESTDLPTPSDEKPEGADQTIGESVKPTEETPLEATSLPASGDQKLEEIFVDSTDTPAPVDGKPDPADQTSGELAKPGEETPIDSTDAPAPVDGKPDPADQTLGELAKPDEDTPIDSTDAPAPIDEKPNSADQTLGELAKPGEETPIDSTDVPAPIDEKPNSADQTIGELAKPDEETPIDSTDAPAPVDEKPDSPDQSLAELVKPDEETPNESTDAPASTDEKPNSADQTLAELAKPAEEIPIDSTDAPAPIEEKPDSPDQTLAELVKPAEETPIDSTDAPAPIDEKPNSADQTLAESVKPDEETPIESTDAPAQIDESLDISANPVEELPTDSTVLPGSVDEKPSPTDEAHIEPSKPEGEENADSNKQQQANEINPPSTAEPAGEPTDLPVPGEENQMATTKEPESENLLVVASSEPAGEEKPSESKPENGVNPAETDKAPEDGVKSTEIPQDGAAETTKRPHVEATVVEEENPDATEATDTEALPVAVPGEGNCLVDGVTYTNGDRVPSTSQCVTECFCNASVVSCAVLECPAPPADVICSPVQKTGDCCPQYVCPGDGEDSVFPDSESQTLGSEESSDKNDVTIDAAGPEPNDTIIFPGPPSFPFDLPEEIILPAQQVKPVDQIKEVEVAPEVPAEKPEEAVLPEVVVPSDGSTASEQKPEESVLPHGGAEVTSPEAEKPEGEDESAGNDNKPVDAMEGLEEATGHGATAPEVTPGDQETNEEENIAVVEVKPVPAEQPESTDVSPPTDGAGAPQTDIETSAEIAVEPEKPTASEDIKVPADSEAAAEPEKPAEVAEQPTAAEDQLGATGTEAEKPVDGSDDPLISGTQGQEEGAGVVPSEPTEDQPLIVDGQKPEGSNELDKPTAPEQNTEDEKHTTGDGSSEAGTASESSESKPEIESESHTLSEKPAETQDGQSQESGALQPDSPTEGAEAPQEKPEQPSEVLPEAQPLPVSSETPEVPIAVSSEAPEAVAPEEVVSQTPEEVPVGVPEESLSQTSEAGEVPQVVEAGQPAPGSTSENLAESGIAEVSPPVVPESSEAPAGTSEEEPSQPEDAQPAEPSSQPEDAQPAEPSSQPEDVQPAEPASQPEDTQPAEPPSKPEDAQPAEPSSQPEGAQPAEPASQPEDAQPAEPSGQPEDAQPAKPFGQPEDAQPAEPQEKPEEKPSEPAEPDREDIAPEAPTGPSSGEQSLAPVESIRPPAEIEETETEFEEESPEIVIGPGACLFDGKVFVSAQQIPREDPCDFCFCFRGDIICLQQSCPPPIPGCFEEAIGGFCCPRYECPVRQAFQNITLQPTLPPLPVLLANRAPVPLQPTQVQVSGCEILGDFFRQGEVIPQASGPCLECKCGRSGMMECDPRACQPEPMLRKMMAAAVKRRRRSLGRRLGKVHHFHLSGERLVME